MQYAPRFTYYTLKIMAVRIKTLILLSLLSGILFLSACANLDSLPLPALGAESAAIAATLPANSAEADVLPTPTLAPITPSATSGPTVESVATTSPAAPLESTEAPIPELSPTATPLPAPTTLPALFTEGDRDMVLIDGKVFNMGAASDVLLAECEQFYASCDVNWFVSAEPIHEVELAPFYIDLVETSNAEYNAFLNELTQHEGACNGQDCLTLDDSAIVQDDNGRYTTDEALINHPVTGITWFGADAYCTWRDTRLPSEAEWEMAASWDTAAGEKLLYPWGNTFDGTAVNTCDVNCDESQAGNDFDDGAVTTAPVGTYESGRSPAGLFDMAGNVWEWVNDWYAADYYAQSAALQPMGPEGGNAKVVRGGSWFDTGNFAGTAIRFPAPPNESGDSIGFRCAMNALPEEELLAMVTTTEDESSDSDPTATPEIEPTTALPQATATPPPSTPTAVATAVAAVEPTPQPTTAASTAPVSVNCDANPGVDLGSTYVVGSCDWFSKVARKLGVTYHALLAVNPQVSDPNIIHAGQILNVPPREGANLAAPSSTQSPTASDALDS